MELYASIKFLDEKCSLKTVKYYYFPVSSVYYDKNDNNHINPNHLSDFENKHKYYILCEDDIRYPGFIVCLGESLEDAENRAIINPKRVIIPKRLTSSDDDLPNPINADEQNSSQNPVKLKICKRQTQKENSQRILETYKSQLLINSRSDLVLENTSNVNNEPTHIIKNCTVSLSDCIRVSTSNGIEQTNTKSTSTIQKEQMPESCNNFISTEQSILSNSQNNFSNLAHDNRFTGKARKTFPTPAASTSHEDLAFPRNSKELRLSPTGKARKSFPTPAASTSHEDLDFPTNCEEQNSSPTVSTSTVNSKSPTSSSLTSYVKTHKLKIDFHV